MVRELGARGGRFTEALRGVDKLRVHYDDYRWVNEELYRIAKKEKIHLSCEIDEEGF